MPVWTLRKAKLVGVNDHSARNSTACVRENLFKNSDALGRDRRKLLIWKATTGLGYTAGEKKAEKLESESKNSRSFRLRRNVLVCSAKFASTFWELKNRTWGRKMIDLLSPTNDAFEITIATRVATSTESTSCPKMMMFGCCSEGWLFEGLARGFACPPDAFENEFLWLEFADPGCWKGTLKINLLLKFWQNICFVKLLLYCDVSQIVSRRWKKLLVRGSLTWCRHWTYSLIKSFALFRRN